MEVLFYLVLCALAGFVGVIEVRLSFNKLRPPLFALFMLGSFIFLTTVEWGLTFRIGGAVIIIGCFLAGVVLGHKDTPVPKRDVRRKRQSPAPAKVDFPYTGKDFTAEGYNDRNGEPVPFT